MDEATVRAIVRDEINKAVANISQGNDFQAWAYAMTQRIGAAGRALDLNHPIPTPGPGSA